MTNSFWAGFRNHTSQNTVPICCAEDEGLEREQRAFLTGRHQTPTPVTPTATPSATSVTCQQPTPTPVCTGVCPQSVPQTEPLSETCNVLTSTPTIAPILPQNCGAIRVREAFGAVFVRREPNNAGPENIIGTFYNQTRTGEDGSTYLYVNPAQRNYTPLGKILDANNYYWVRIHHNPQINNGTQGWMRSDSLDLLACGGINAIPEIPAASVGYGPNGLTPITDPNASIPNLSELWLPFGDCQGYADDQDRRRCSFDILSTLVAHGALTSNNVRNYSAIISSLNSMM